MYLERINRAAETVAKANIWTQSYHEPILIHGSGLARRRNWSWCSSSKAWIDLRTPQAIARIDPCSGSCAPDRQMHHVDLSNIYAISDILFIATARSRQDLGACSESVEKKRPPVPRNAHTSAGCCHPPGRKKRFDVNPYHMRFDCKKYKISQAPGMLTQPKVMSGSTLQARRELVVHRHSAQPEYTNSKHLARTKQFHTL